MKLEQHMESLRQLDDSALAAFQRVSAEVEHRVQPALLAKAIGAVLLASVSAVSVGTAESTRSEEASLATRCGLLLPCFEAALTQEPQLSSPVPSPTKSPAHLAKKPTTAAPHHKSKLVAPAPKAKPTDLPHVSRLRTSMLNLRAGTIGVDVSYPNCDVPIRPDAKFGIVGVNGGRPFTMNECLAEEVAKFKNPGLYVNTSLNLAKARAENDPSIKCSVKADLCASYRWGYRAGKFAVNSAKEQGVVSHEWYIDVETANKWSDSDAHNRASIKGTMDAIRKTAAKTMGVGQNHIYQAVYSNTRMWGIITGGWQLPDTHVWYATGGRPEPEATAFCDKEMADFTGGGVVMVQTGNHDKSFPYSQDINIRC